MSFYGDMAATATDLLTEFGTALTITGLPTAADPVTGLGASAGASRSVTGLLSKVNFRLFPESGVQTGDQMLIVDGAAGIVMGEAWAGRKVVDIKTIMPDNATRLVQMVLVRG